MLTFKTVLKYLLAIAFVAAGALHFIWAEFYLRIMPPVLPTPLFWVYLSGIFEIILGVLLLIPKYAPVAAWGLVALLVAVFPANIYMATNASLFPEFNSILLYLRLPLQFVLIALAFWFTRKNA